MALTVPLPQSVSIAEEGIKPCSLVCHSIRYTTLGTWATEFCLQVNKQCDLLTENVAMITTLDGFRRRLDKLEDKAMIQISVRNYGKLLPSISKAGRLLIPQVKKMALGSFLSGRSPA